MEYTVSEFFQNFNHLVVSAYFLSLALLLGSLFTVLFLVKPFIYCIKAPYDRYRKSIDLLGKYIVFVAICMFIMMLNGIVYALGCKCCARDLNAFISVDIIKIFWFFMVVNFIYIYSRYRVVKLYFSRNDHIQVHENLELIFTYALPLNFILSIACAYFDVVTKVHVC